MNSALTIIEQCRIRCKASPKRIVLCDSLDTRLLQAANKLQKNGFADPILIGNPFELRDHAHLAGVGMPSLEIIHPVQAPYFDQFVETYAKNNPSITRDTAEKSMRNPLFYAAMMLNSGQADICVAGNLSTSADVLRAALRVVGVSEKDRAVSSFFLMISPDKKSKYLFADASVVPEPTVEQLANIAIDAASSFSKLTGETPRVAMLSFSTKGSSSHPAAQRVKEAFELVRKMMPDLIIDGELQFDAAVVPGVAQLKCPDSPLQGSANVLIFPSLDAANIAYKVAQRLGDYQALGPLLQGLKKPMHDLSRGCSADDIVNIAILASCMHEQSKIVFQSPIRH